MSTLKKCQPGGGASGKVKRIHPLDYLYKILKPFLSYFALAQRGGAIPRALPLAR